VSQPFAPCVQGGFDGTSSATTCILIVARVVLGHPHFTSKYKLFDQYVSIFKVQMIHALACCSYFDTLLVAHITQACDVIAMMLDVHATCTLKTLLQCCTAVGYV
jgi:hypothetical protein